MEFPDHKAGMFLEHNAHKNIYQSVKDWILEDNSMLYWESAEHKERAIESDEVWTLQWYPDTPIGFYMIAAPTLEELLKYAKKMSK